MKRGKKRGKTITGCLVALGLSLTSTAAQAWDPSTTHTGMTTRALVDSAVHVRWMDATDLSRGLFTAIRVDPARLDEDLARRIEVAVRRAHADSGAQIRGGPGACPGVTAPPSTRTRCVKDDLWEGTAVGWIALGVIAETSPRERMLHHFLDPKDPGAATWKGRKLPRRVMRSLQRRGDGPSLLAMTGTAFDGKTASAMGWLSDADDPWAPPAMFEHLRQASLLADPRARQHHLALALVGLGALLHVVQDASVPAHSRADLAAFIAPLSDTPGDRGLPLAEFARMTFGRTALPTRLPLLPRDAESRRGVVLAPTLAEHLVAASGANNPTHEGVAVTAGARFLSEGTLPAPQRLDPGLSATEAADVLLAGSGLLEVETAGAELTPWPSDSGYLVSAQGRPLAAFTTDDLDRVQLVLDRRVYRDQVGHLVPLAIDASRSIVDLIFPAFPELEIHPGGNVLELDASDLPGTEPVLTILIEDRTGQRRQHKEMTLRAGERNRIVGAMPKLAEGERTVLVIRHNLGPHRATVESLLPLPEDETKKAGKAQGLGVTGGRTGGAAETDPETDAETDAETEPDAETETETETESGAETETDAETETESDSAVPPSPTQAPGGGDTSKAPKGTAGRKPGAVATPDE